MTLIDGNNNVPEAINVDVQLTLTTGTLGNDQCAYVFAARSVDGTNFEAGPPAIGATDAAFTFSDSPVGASPLPTDMILLGVIPFNAQSQARRKIFTLYAPTAKFAIVILNYSGIALASSGNSVQYRSRFGDGR